MGGSDSEADKSALKEKKNLLALAPIAKPLAGKKLSKRTLKLVRKGTFLFLFVGFIFYKYVKFIFCIFIFLNVAAEHKCLKRGVKEVVKSIRRGNKGYVCLNVIRLVYGGLSTYECHMIIIL